MELTYAQFRHVIEQKIVELQALPPTPEILADISTLQVLLAGLPNG